MGQDLNELQTILAQIFNGEKPSLIAIENFMTRNEASKVASSFIKLFSSLS
jgi:hypothetical protein